MKTILTLMLLTSLAFGQTKRQATLAQQKMCSEQARVVFEREGRGAPPSEYLLWEFTSHYNAQANVCYVMTHAMTATEDRHINSTRYVFDAFEGRILAGVVIVNWTVNFCSIKGGTQDCKDENDFLNIVERKYGIGR
jgi:hypothetical protein